MRSWHVLGSRQFGGADQFYVRLIQALNEEPDHHVLAINREGVPAALALAGDCEQRHLPLANKYDRYTTWRLGRWIARERPDIVQTYMGRATRLTRVPSPAASVHIARLGGYYKIRGYYEHAHAWVGNTQGVCDYLVREGLPASRVFKIGNFVPEREASADAQESVRLRRDLDIPDDALVLFTLGRFIGVKGFDDLLEAFARMPSSSHDRPLYLIVAGDGPLKQPLHELAGRLNVETRVRWPGWIERPAPFFELADIMVCPSRHETLGNVILEAWRYAKPVVATRTPGALELVAPDESGVLCDVHSPAALADALLSLLRAPTSERERLGIAGQAQLQAHHGRQAVVRAYTDLYHRLCDAR